MRIVRYRCLFLWSLCTSTFSPNRIATAFTIIPTIAFFTVLQLGVRDVIFTSCVGVSFNLLNVFFSIMHEAT